MVLLGIIRGADDLWGATTVLPSELASRHLADVPELGSNVPSTRRRSSDVGASLVGGASFVA
jgi:hypothetical protein